MPGGKTAAFGIYLMILAVPGVFRIGIFLPAELPALPGPVYRPSPVDGRLFGGCIFKM
jgi:hypothetical protein